MASSEVNGYKVKGALQTAGIVGGLLIATVVISTFIIDRIVGPNLIAIADDRFEARIVKHNEYMHERGINRQISELRDRQQRTLERMDKLVTKEDLAQFLAQLNRAIYGDSQ